ncbi:MAG TPA: hypothetical protein VJ647_01150 [Chitinophagaceae bacterium]|nr:hypothetical protein [Chitinophagaceae bacterium]
MKTKVFLLALLAVTVLSISSCVSSKSGCAMTKGYVGYGTR